MGKRYRGNRHGFQNFGGRHTGMPGKMEESHIVACRQIALAIETRNYLTTKQFDEMNLPTGAVIRHDLRQHGLIFETAVENADWKYVDLTPKAKVLIKFDRN